jgi:hypothetical protein
VQIQLGGCSWPTKAKITARRAIYYIAFGEPEADILIACSDFGRDIAVAGGTFLLEPSTLQLR